MERAFKYLRISTAALLVLTVFWIFFRNLQAQNAAMLDGQLAHYISYTWGFNRITLAILLGFVLVFDFKLVLPSWGRKCLRILGIASVILSLLGFVYLTRQVIFSSQIRANSLGWFYFEFYLFQLAYLLVSCIALSKSFEPNSNLDVSADKPK